MGAKRASAMRNDFLLRLSEKGDVLVKPIRLADFLRPNVFLNALRQQTSQKLQTAMDSLVLVSCFSGTQKAEQLKNSATWNRLPKVQVEGLLLEGATFDRRAGLLVEAGTQSASVNALPTLTLGWAPQNSADIESLKQPGASSSSNGEVEVPVYTALSREKLLCSVWVQTDNARRRVLNATAIFLTEE